MRAEPELALTSTYHPCNQVAGIMRVHITAALTSLDSARPNASRIHATRQEIKHARAALRLLRESIDPEYFRQEDATLRQAAQELNDVRDAEVVLQALSRVQNALKDGPQRPNLTALRKLLQQERRAATSTALRERLAAARTVLVQAKERTRVWPVANDLELLTKAMQRTYRKGRTCYRAARESRTDEQLHAWRRQVKYIAYQLEALGSLAPGRMRRRVRRCARLAKILGKDHDLLMLLRRTSDANLDAAASLRLDRAIKGERARLQRRALELGKRLYRAKPRKFQPIN